MFFSSEDQKSKIFDAESSIISRTCLGHLVLLCFPSSYHALNFVPLCHANASGTGLEEYPLPDPNFFFATRTWPELFFKIFELGLFPLSCFPADCFKSFNNKLQILSFSSRPDMNSSVSKSKCRDRRNGNSEKFDNYFWYIFIYSSWHRGNQTNQSKG